MKVRGALCIEEVLLRKMVADKVITPMKVAVINKS
jgi:hypothetical protein